MITLAAVVSFIVILLVIVIVLALINKICDYFGLDPQIKAIILIVLVLILVVRFLV